MKCKQCERKARKRGELCARCYNREYMKQYRSTQPDEPELKHGAQIICDALDIDEKQFVQFLSFLQKQKDFTKAINLNGIIKARIEKEADKCQASKTTNHGNEVHEIQHCLAPTSGTHLSKISKSEHFQATVLPPISCSAAAKSR